MAVVDIRGSTADGSGGVQVAGAVYEGGAGPTVPWGVASGNKSTFGATSRTGITAVDTGTTDLSASGFGSTGLVDLCNCLNVVVSGTCDTASGVITGRLVWYDEAGTPLCIGWSDVITLTADAAETASSGQYVANVVLVDAICARKARFYAISRTGTTWIVNLRPV